jgi:four helix bundle protein
VGEWSVVSREWPASDEFGMSAGPIESYEDFEVWPLAMTLAEHCYELTKDFPREELYGLTSQIRRAVVSMPANVAEGYGRDQTGNFIQFLRISQGSARELETHLLLSSRLKLVGAERVAPFTVMAVRVSKMLRGLLRSLESHHDRSG